MTQSLVLDSVTHLTAAHRGAAAVCASHGGTYAGFYAAKMGVGAVILNDAGVGRDQAGIAGLKLLDGLGVPAACIAHTSARIGDGHDGHARGEISFVNDTALRLGVRVGMSCATALHHLAQSPLVASPPPPALAEARFDIRVDHAQGVGDDAVRVFGIDSNALVIASDAGHIAVTGSHGGLLGNKPETAIKVDVRAAIYNDAGIGMDAAGISRLPALDARGIAGACVSAMSARIGDARSTYDDGIISALNDCALRAGGSVGQSCRAFVATMVRA